MCPRRASALAPSSAAATRRRWTSSGLLPVDEDLDLRILRHLAFHVHDAPAVRPFQQQVVVAEADELAPRLWDVDLVLRRRRRLSECCVGGDALEHAR